MIPWGNFPFKDEFKKMAEDMKPGDIQSYVNEMMRKFNVTQFSDTTENPSNPSDTSDLGSNVFETFDSVYIRLSLPKDVTLKHLRIYHTSNQAILENIHEKGDRKVIVLPCVVKKKGATAQVKDNILEIKIPRSDDLQFTEVSISEKL